MRTMQLLSTLYIKHTKPLLLLLLCCRLKYCQHGGPFLVCKVWVTFFACLLTAEGVDMARHLPLSNWRAATSATCTHHMSTECPDEPAMPTSGS